MAFYNRRKKNTVRFEGTMEERRKNKNEKNVIISKRLTVLLIFLLTMSLILTSRLAFLQIAQQGYFEAKLEKYGVSVYRQEASRGEIVDREGVKLVRNINVNNAVYYAPKSITDKEIKTNAEFIVNNISLENVKIDDRQKKDYFILAFPKIVEGLVTEEEQATYKEMTSESKANAESYLTRIKLERITEELMAEHMDNNLLHKTRLEYLMSSCTAGATVLVEDLSVEDASSIGANGVILKGIQVDADWTREYVQGSDFSTVLGKVTTKKQGLTLNQKDLLLALDYQNDARIGTSGIEQQYEMLLRGIDSTYIIEHDSNGNPTKVPQSEGENGSTLRLSIDWELQTLCDQLITEELQKANSRNKYFDQLYFMLMDPKNGDIIVMSAKQIDKETGEVSDLAHGNYMNASEIGSTSKGGTIYVGFKEGILEPGTTYYDTPWYIKGTKAKKSWKNLGNITEIEALALSSNVYMFNIAVRLANANYVPNESLNIDLAAFDTYRQGVGELGLGVKTGIDIPYENSGVRRSNVEGGKLLDLCIGQFDTYTNVQLAQYVATLANGGVRVQPRLLIESYREEYGNKVSTYENTPTALGDVSNQAVAFQQI